MTLCTAFIGKNGIGYMVADSGMGQHPYIMQALSEKIMTVGLRYPKTKLVDLPIEKDYLDIGIAFSGRDGRIISDVVNEMDLKIVSIEVNDLHAALQVILDRINKKIRVNCERRKIGSPGIQLLFIGYCPDQTRIRIFKTFDMRDINEFYTIGNEVIQTIGISGLDAYLKKDAYPVIGDVIPFYKEKIKQNFLGKPIKHGTLEKYDFVFHKSIEL